MNIAQNIRVTFYQHLGRLFYAVAASDRVVRKSEYESLRKIVTSKWLQLDDIEDEFEVDAAFHIEIVFDWLDYREELNAEECFYLFEEYYHEHIDFFTEDIKKLIWDTCSGIANAFSGSNKSELIMLGRLKLLFE